MVSRRAAALAAAIALFAEAAGSVLVHGVLALVIGNQRMSLAGLDPDAMVTGTRVMGGVSGLYLALCGALLLTAALRDRSPARVSRILLVSCAVAHGVLGALAVGLVGLLAFAFLMVVLGLLVLTLVSYAPEASGTAVRPDAAPE